MVSIANMLHASNDQLVPINSTETMARSARTELGRKLLKLRQRIVASGQPLLDLDELDGKVRDRRGEQQTET